MEIPRLTLKPSILRFVFPRALGLLVLCSIFYILLLVNLYFIFKEIEILYYYIALIFIILLYLFGVVIEYIKANNWSYLFFNDRVEFHTKHNHRQDFILYNEVTEITMKQNIFDKIFNTATFILKPSFEVRFIKYSNNTYFYVQKLVERSRKLQEIVK